MTRFAQLQAVAFEMTSLAQMVVDVEGRLVVANQSAHLLLGLVANDMGGLLQDLPLATRPIALRSYIEQSYRDRASILVSEVERSHSNGAIQYLDVRFTPLHSPDQELLGCSISFQDVTLYAQLRREFRALTQELATTNEELESSQEELATMNEALQATNEELEATNEELQATNEELETMNEELQAKNEELKARIDKSSD